MHYVRCIDCTTDCDAEHYHPCTFVCCGCMLIGTWPSLMTLVDRSRSQEGSQWPSDPMQRYARCIFMHAASAIRRYVIAVAVVYIRLSEC